MTSDHFTLPEGNVQIAFSGGRTSAYMLYRIIEANDGIPDRAVVTFQNTGREMDETLDFVAEVGNRWGVHIVWLEYRPDAPFFEIVNHNSADRTGAPFKALVRKRRFLPNVRSRFCTVELKVRTAKRYLRSLGWDYWTNCVGIRADEPKRIRPEQVRFKDRWTVWQPMAKAGIGRHDVAAFWASQPFDLRLPNVDGKCWLGNCDGCFLKSEANVAALAREYPGRAAWWEDMEAEIAAMWPALTPWQRLRRVVAADDTIAADLRGAYGRPIPPSVIQMIVDHPRSAGQFSKRYGRKEIRTTIERQGDWLFSDEAREAGVLCPADDGDCTG